MDSKEVKKGTNYTLFLHRILLYSFYLKNDEGLTYTTNHNKHICYIKRMLLHKHRKKTKHCTKPIESISDKLIKKKIKQFKKYLKIL